MAEKEYIIAKPHENGEGYCYIIESRDTLYPHLTSVKGAMKYTFAEAATIKEKYQRTWDKWGLKVFKVEQVLGEEMRLP